MCGSDARSAEDREQVVFLHHQQLDAVQLHFGAAVLAEQHLVADLDLRRADLAVVQHLAGADGDDFALDRLLGGRIRDHDPAGGQLLFFHALDDHAVVQRLDIGHGNLGKWLIDVEKPGDFSSRAKRVPNRGQQNRANPACHRDGAGPPTFKGRTRMSARPAGSGQPLPYAGERPDLLLHLSRRRQRRAHRHRAGGRAPGRLRQPPARPAFGLSLATQGRGRGRGPAAGQDQCRGLPPPCRNACANCIPTNSRSCSRSKPRPACPNTCNGWPPRADR